MAPPFKDRHDAGRQLAALLQRYVGRRDVLVLGLARGGVTVASEVALALDAPLDILVVRKLGVPEHEEVPMGAITSGGVRVLDSQLIRRLHIPDEVTRTSPAEVPNAVTPWGAGSRRGRGARSGPARCHGRRSASR